MDANGLTLLAATVDAPQRGAAPLSQHRVGKTPCAGCCGWRASALGPQPSVPAAALAAASSALERIPRTVDTQAPRGLLEKRCGQRQWWARRLPAEARRSPPCTRHGAYRSIWSVFDGVLYCANVRTLFGCMIWVADRWADVCVTAAQALWPWRLSGASTRRSVGPWKWNARVGRLSAADRFALYRSRTVRWTTRYRVPAGIPRTVIRPNLRVLPDRRSGLLEKARCALASDSQGGLAHASPGWRRRKFGCDVPGYCARSVLQSAFVLNGARLRLCASNGWMPRARS
jgi:hypothetical protein